MLPPLGLDADTLPPLLLPLRRTPQIFDAEFRRFRRRSLLLIVVTLAVLSLAVFGAEMIGTRGYTVDAAWDVVALILLAGLLAALPVDLLCLSASAVALSDALRQGRWDVLVLTNADLRDLIRAQETEILARVWKPLAVAINLRIAASLAVAIWLVVISGSSGVLFDFALVVLAYSYLYEPLWRTRALAANGLLISAYARQSVSALLAAMGIVLLIWGTQALLIGAALLWVRANDYSAFVVCPVAYLSLSFAVHRAYGWAERTALAAAARRMACCADDLR